MGFLFLGDLLRFKPEPIGHVLHEVQRPEPSITGPTPPHNECVLSIHLRSFSNRTEYENVFPEETPHGLPPIRGIEHQIDFVPDATIPNRPAYRTNPEETKELQRQVSELLEKGYVRESMSQCVVPVILVPKKDGT
ncbi:hypothetical protein CRG98_032479 [Punica granatum]|uniref:Reverse transcriptase domain-containing protein n=1 Tax=Punica granatum TaxID=22663 RepID=A0A2I0IT08_PUNGR|nr:hypothetical protein CRG98_032479 [Punica granatum]